MNVLTTLAAQIESFNTPLFAVTLTALPIPNTPVLLMMHWHGFYRQQHPEAGQSKMPLQSLPGTVIQLNHAWQSTAVLDEAMLDAAWQMGAWELDREEKRACNTAGADDMELHTCRQAFAFGQTGGEELHLIEAPDIHDMLEVGARKGYMRWQFRPVRGGIWRNVGDDDSLNDSGGREPPCPHGVKQLCGTAIGLTRYRLGRQTHLYLP